MDQQWKRKILCIGAGYVGGPTMAVIALNCPEHRVEVVDVNSRKIEQWNSSALPIFEQSLIEIIQQVRGRNLFFSTDIPKGIKQADIVFVSVNTPTKTFGEGAGYAADLQYYEKTARDIVKYAEGDKLIVEKSTLPVRTAEAMMRILHSSASHIQYEVISNPEFLSEGTAIHDLQHPDRVLIGSLQTGRGIAAAKVIKDIYLHWVPEERILLTNVWSSELSKLVANAFLAQRVSSINSISVLCEKTGADVEEVAYAIGKDKRIGSRFLKAGPGFGGSCFRKDILNLVYLCRHYGLDEVADFWESVIRINDYQRERLVRAILEHMFNTVAGKRIAIFGFAFKADTGDTRDSSAIAVCKRLIEERAILAITDPKALDNARQDLAEMDEQVEYVDDPYVAVRSAHAIVLLTEWSQFRTLDYQRCYKMMERPAFVFDSRSLLDHQKLFEIGFNVIPVGKQPLIQESSAY